MRLIEEETIEFTNETPYHEITMYKQLLNWHLALTTRAIVLNELRSKDTSSKIKGSFVEDKITREYKTCIPTEEHDYKLQNQNQNDIEFSHFIFDGGCFLNGCETFKNIRIFIHENSMFIIFGTGFRFIEEIDSLDKVCAKGRKNCLNKDIFYAFLNFIKDLSSNITQIILCGHSHGMAVATITAFILEAVKNSRYKEQCVRIIGNWGESIDRWEGKRI